MIIIIVLTVSVFSLVSFLLLCGTYHPTPYETERNGLSREGFKSLSADRNSGYIAAAPHHTQTQQVPQSFESEASRAESGMLNMERSIVPLSMGAYDSGGSDSQFLTSSILKPSMQQQNQFDPNAQSGGSDFTVSLDADDINREFSGGFVGLKSVHHGKRAKSENKVYFEKRAVDSFVSKPGELAEIAGVISKSKKKRRRKKRRHTGNTHSTGNTRKKLEEI